MKIKRSGFVHKLYRRNMMNLWAITFGIVLGFAIMVGSSFNYLMNYLFYRSTPDEANFTATAEADMLDPAAVMENVDANGGYAMLEHSLYSMFYKDNVYQEGGRYRFSIDIDPDRLTDTGIYYDNTGITYSGITDRNQLTELVPRENYPSVHLWLYEYDNVNFVLASDYDKDDELSGAQRVTFAPMGIYAVYMICDLDEAGYTAPVCNYLIDFRDTPVDYEDEDFKDAVMLFPFTLIFLIVSILLTVFPQFHPTYRQLAKYGRTIAKAVEKVDKDYEEFGVQATDKKTIFLNEWLVNKSLFKYGIETNYKKQKN